jgi:hypothetical protein
LTISRSSCKAVKGRNVAEPPSETIVVALW